MNAGLAPVILLIACSTVARKYNTCQCGAMNPSPAPLFSTTLLCLPLTTLHFGMDLIIAKRC